MRSAALKCLRLAGLAALLYGLTPALSHAALCTVDTTNPDAEATGIEGATTCGLGSGQHPTDTLLDGFIAAGDWFEIDKDETQADPNPTTDSQLFYAGKTFEDNDPTKLPTSGDWGIDLAGNTYDYIALILKDGNASTDTGQEADQWVWFVVDLDGSCPADTTLILASYAQADLCGQWWMYGHGTNRAGLSYMSIWGIEGGGGGEQELPEPGTLLLFGVGLAGAALIRRRRYI